jgi:hypothetical protein
MDLSDFARKNDPRFPKSLGLCAECGEEFDVSDMEDCDDCLEDRKTGITPALCSDECKEGHDKRKHNEEVIV